MTSESVRELISDGQEHDFYLEGSIKGSPTVTPGNMDHLELDVVVLDHDDPVRVRLVYKKNGSDHLIDIAQVCDAAQRHDHISAQGRLAPDPTNQYAAVLYTGDFYTAPAPRNGNGTQGPH